jgi:hypothetical protein
MSQGVWFYASSSEKAALAKIGNMINGLTALINKMEGVINPSLLENYKRELQQTQVLLQHAWADLSDKVKERKHYDENGNANDE